MATVWIPSLLRELTDGQAQVDVPGATVGQVIDALEYANPGIKKRLCPGGQIDPAITLSVDGRVAPLGLMEAVEEHSEIHLLPALAGG